MHVSSKSRNKDETIPIFLFHEWKFNLLPFFSSHSKIFQTYYIWHFKANRIIVAFIVEKTMFSKYTIASDARWKKTKQLNMKTKCNFQNLQTKKKVQNDVKVYASHMSISKIVRSIKPCSIIFLFQIKNDNIPNLLNLDKVVSKILTVSQDFMRRQEVWQGRTVVQNRSFGNSPLLYFIDCSCFACFVIINFV